MRRINYKSDIPPLLLSLKVDEKQITVPDCDFIVRFYIDGYEGRHYDCSHIGGVWSNCEPSEDGTKLVCYINNQRLGIGELCAEFHYISPDKRYSDGSKKSVVIIGSTELGVELVEDNGDAVTEAAINVTLPFIYRTAYEIARDHGYTGTAEDFYSALASVVGIAEAEAGRVSSEELREANEQQRVLEFDAMKDIVDELEGKVDGVVEGEKSFEDAIRDQINNYKPIVIEGNVTNAADEEDITSENGLLKLKDRSALNGIGYVILRQNKDFAEQVIKANTIYEIRYDFDLNGAEITIPENCILYFKGGKLLNGSWKYSSKGNYIIKATQVGFIEGASEKIANFNGTLLQNLMTANIGIDFENKEYNLNISRQVPCNFIYIKGGTLNMNVSQLSIFKGLNNSTDKPIIHIENTTINNIGDRKTVYLLFAENFDFYYDYCLIKKCTFNNFLSIRLDFGDFDSNIHKVGVSTTIIEDCIFKDLMGTFYLCDNAYYNSVVIRGNTIRNNKYSVFYFGTTNEYESSANIDRNGKFIFENNNHVNDFDFLSAPNSNYICTVLVEGNEVYFNNNTFENIRAFNSVVYAFYVSSVYFRCTNNVIKNVFNFNQCTYPIVKLSYNNCYNEVFKSKGGRGSLTNPNTRIFDSNIVTINRENYISAMKLSSEFPDDYAHYDDVMLFTRLFSPVEPQNIEFTNNNIDIEGVISLATSTEDILNIKYNYNKLRFYNANRFDGSDPLSVLDTDYPSNLVASYLDKYTTTFEIIGNTFECTNNEKYATFYFASFSADKNNQNYNNPMTVIIKNNIGNNVWLRLLQSVTAYTGDVTPKKDILVEGNTSNVAGICYEYASNFTEIPSVGNIKIKGNFTWKGRFYSKLLDLEFNVSNIASANNTNNYTLKGLEVPKLDTENECYVLSYTKKDGSNTDIEIYKDTNSYLANSNAYVDYSIFYRDISEPIYLYFDDDVSNSGFILRLNGKTISIQVLIGINNQFNSYKLKYYPYRKNLKLDRGQSKYRPKLGANDEGFEYYDTTLKKYIVWNGTEWTNMDGTNLT